MWKVDRYSPTFPQGIRYKNAEFVMVCSACKAVLYSEEFGKKTYRNHDTGLTLVAKKLKNI